MRQANAVTRERSRIARELHDVAAHHLSGIVVQAGAAENLIDRDPDRAKEILRDLRGQGRQTLRSMRFLVGVLRAGQEGPSGPQPDVAHIPDLVEQARLTGACIQLVMPAELPELDRAVGFATYRIVQESISNARRHAPGAVIWIAIDTDEDDVILEVRNERSTGGSLSPGSGPGFRLVGMQERAELLNGHLQAGRLLDGGWRVRARLPRQEMR